MLRTIQTFLAVLLLGLAPAAAQSPLDTLATADAGKGWEAVGRLDIGQ